MKNTPLLDPERMSKWNTMHKPINCWEETVSWKRDVLRTKCYKHLFRFRQWSLNHYIRQCSL